MTRPLLALGLALAFAPTSSAGVPNPCALVTNAEVAKVLGSKVAFRSSQGNQLSRMCVWTGQPMGYMQSRQSVRMFASQSTSAKFNKVANGTPGAVRVRGLGEAAYSTGHTLEVFQGGIALGLLSGDLLPAAEAKRLAAAALRGL